jgi:hypothetical protein
MRLPTVLSGTEVERLVGTVATKKQRAMALLAYGAGLRVSEIVKLIWPPVGCRERPSAPCPPANVPIEPTEPTAQLPRSGSVQPDDDATAHTRLGPRTVARAVSQSPSDYAYPGGLAAAERVPKRW